MGKTTEVRFKKFLREERKILASIIAVCNSPKPNMKLLDSLNAARYQLDVEYADVCNIPGL